MSVKYFYSFLLFLFSALAFAQSDTVPRQGTIKIVKHKDGPVYIKAKADYSISGPNRFQPYPVVPGHAFPFNYTRFFWDYFKNTKIDLRGKNSDTVYMEVSISKKGKVRIQDVTYSMSNGKRMLYDAVQVKEMSGLHLNCFNALNQVKEWYPAYDVDTKVDRYKGQTVIRPVRTKRDATGIITIIFSTEPFDE
ncbi:MAG: hypothetical protein JWO44_2100 [Bacteroidetes bacterium]|nr:hypothetical protein [Bacteroidota bacterium]